MLLPDQLNWKVLPETTDHGHLVDEDETYEIFTERAEVPGGYLLRTVVLKGIRGSLHSASAPCFVPVENLPERDDG